MADDGASTEAHRLGQVRIAAGAARAALEGWRQVSPTDVEGTAGGWLAETLALTRSYRRRSRELSAAYVRLHRAESTGATLPPIGPGPRRGDIRLGELRDEFVSLAGGPRLPRGDDTVTVTVDEDFEWPEEDEEGADRAATVSLVVTGPVPAQRGVDRLRVESERGRLDDADFLDELDGVMRDAGVRVAGAAEREALRGGRDLLDAASRADRRVIGWVRITDSDPCAFCALLASRGAVYRSAERARYVGQTRRRARARMPDGWEDWSPERLAEWEAGQGIARYHDNCRCTIMPVYSRGDWLPDQSRAFRELYDEATEGLSGPRARAAFRAAMQERRRRARARGVSVA